MKEWCSNSQGICILQKKSNNKPLSHRKEFLIIWYTIWESNGEEFAYTGESHEQLLTHNNIPVFPVR